MSKLLDEINDPDVIVHLTPLWQLGEEWDEDEGEEEEEELDEEGGELEEDDEFDGFIIE